MSDTHYFCDEELIAHLDGDGDEERVRAISAALLVDKELNQRIAQLTLPIGQIKSAFDTMLISAPLYPLNENNSRKNNGFLHIENGSRVFRSIAAVALICLPLGWLAGQYMAPAQPTDWQQSVAIYHALYVKDTLAQVSQSSVAVQEELTRVSAVLGKSFDPNALTGNTELVYKRAQVLGYKGRVLVQFAFLSKTGVPIALCVIKNTKPNDAQVTSGELLGMREAQWSKGSYDYFLVGGNDVKFIDDAATMFFARL